MAPSFLRTSQRKFRRQKTPEKSFWRFFAGYFRSRAEELRAKKIRAKNLHVMSDEAETVHLALAKGGMDE